MPNAMTIASIARVLDRIRLDQAGTDDLVGRLREPGSLVEVLKAEAELEDYEVEYLSSIPDALVESMRAAAVSALAAGKAVHLQYSPAYDFEVHVWDFGHAVSLHLGGPYPPDFPRAGWLTQKA